jgi:serine/threonine protein kinase
MTMPVQPGDILLGKYRVEHVLGQGGMGVVVAATHLDLAELFAIKFLLPEALESDQAVERFLREARAAARLKGEHVAKVHDVGRLESGAPYMVMEHLEGMDLDKVGRAHGPLPVEEAVLYVLQACDAVAEAHARGIVHRDLKPANLFLTQRHDGTACVKVLDFGISKQRTQDSLELTTTGMVLGSPLYMSPEQMIRSKEVDLRSDIWSMGVVLYKLLTGHAPFQAETLTELVGRVLQDTPMRPSQLRPDLSRALDAIVLRCLKKRPEQRFATMDALAAALRSLPLGPAVTLGRTALGSARQLSQVILETPTLVAGSTPEVNTITTWVRTRAAASWRGETKVVAGAIAALALLGGGGAWLGLRGHAAEASRTEPVASLTALVSPPSAALRPPKVPAASEAIADVAPAEPVMQAADAPQPRATAKAVTALLPPAARRNPASEKSMAPLDKPSSKPLSTTTAKTAAIPTRAPPKYESMF